MGIAAVVPVMTVKLIILFTFLLFELLRTAEALTSTESKEFMNGRVLRVLIFHYPPSMIITQLSNGTIHYRGISFDIMDYMARALNISYEYVSLKADYIKKYGTALAQVKAIANNEADYAPCGVFPPSVKYHQVDFTIPFVIESIKIVVPWPEQENEHLLNYIISPFQPKVWLCLGVSLVAVALSLLFLSGIYRKYSNKDSPLHLNDGSEDDSQSHHQLINFSSLGRSAIFIWSLLTFNRFYFVRLNSLRGLLFVIGAWGLMALVVSNVYTSTRLSFMTVTKLGPVINSLNDLAHSKDTQLVGQANTDIFNRFLDHEANGTDKILGDKLRSNPENAIYHFNLDKLKAKMMTDGEKFATVHIRSVTHGIIHSTYRENGNKCKFTLAKEVAQSFATIVQMMRKNGPFTKALNEQIQNLLDAGLIDYFIRKYVPRIDQCLMKNQKPETRYCNLSLQNMSFTFFVFGSGLGLTAIVFIIELVNNKWISPGHKKDNSNPIRRGKAVVKVINKTTQLVVAAAIVHIEVVPIVVEQIKQVHVDTSIVQAMKNPEKKTPAIRKINRFD